MGRRASMDLHAVADVIADPSIVAWGSARPDQVWAVLSGVVAWAAAKGTKDAWGTPRGGRSGRGPQPTVHLMWPGRLHVI
jgi:hypothetical protein